MTRTEWHNMRYQPHEQRIKVAELCGYELKEKRREGKFTFVILFLDGEQINARQDAADTLDTRMWYAYETPSYLHSLEAMNEAEEKLTPGQWRAYVCNLITILEIDPALDSDDLPDHFALIRAGAAQRAEAFALTMEDQSC